ncbi:hypothetical protein J8J20_22560, partial [Mycobacterium tuberculosis]|nr:hypothetical protein [Mycobacterium tuberculosis]
LDRAGELLGQSGERAPVDLPTARARVPPAGGEGPGAEGLDAVGGGGGTHDDDEVRRRPQWMLRVALGDGSAPVELEREPHATGWPVPRA